ncbi:hypothetical protein DFQ26_000944 [Actinomortierella ambigua]|nr:hypothetical protein DFQ26_000944 [Actinomortierella ambigua]
MAFPRDLIEGIIVFLGLDNGGGGGTHASTCPPPAKSGDGSDPPTNNALAILEAGQQSIKGNSQQHQRQNQHQQNSCMGVIPPYSSSPAPPVVTSEHAQGTIVHPWNMPMTSGIVVHSAEEMLRLILQQQHEEWCKEQEEHHRHHERHDDGGLSHSWDDGNEKKKNKNAGGHDNGNGKDSDGGGGGGGNGSDGGIGLLKGKGYHSMIESSSTESCDNKMDLLADQRHRPTAAAKMNEMSSSSYLSFSPSGLSSPSTSWLSSSVSSSSLLSSSSSSSGSSSSGSSSSAASSPALSLPASAGMQEPPRTSTLPLRLSKLSFLWNPSTKAFGPTNTARATTTTSTTNATTAPTTLTATTTSTAPTTTSNSSCSNGSTTTKADRVPTLRRVQAHHDLSRQAKISSSSLHSQFQGPRHPQALVNNGHGADWTASDDEEMWLFDEAAVTTANQPQHHDDHLSLHQCNREEDSDGGKVPLKYADLSQGENGEEEDGKVPVEHADLEQVENHHQPLCAPRVEVNDDVHTTHSNSIITTTSNRSNITTTVNHDQNGDGNKKKTALESLKDFCRRASIGRSSTFTRRAASVAAANADADAVADPAAGTPSSAAATSGDTPDRTALLANWHRAQQRLIPEEESSGSGGSSGHLQSTLVASTLTYHDEQVPGSGSQDSIVSFPSPEFFEDSE